LLDLGAAEVIGVDLQPGMLALASRLLVPPSRSQQLRFQRADLRQPLPFAGRSFDAVWLGDAWLADALPELRRVLRPGALLIAKRSGLLSGQTYAWDGVFDARMHAALRQAQHAKYGGAPEQGMWGALMQAGPWRHMELWTVLVERFAPVPALWEVYALQNWGLFEGAFLHDVVDAADWERLAQLWQPNGPRYLFRHPDGHFIQSLTFASGRIDG